MIELAGVALGLFGKPIANILTGIFSKKKKPEEIAGALATGASPEILPAYIEAIGKLRASEAEYFNRDVRGETAKWVNTLRSAIRPCGVVIAILALVFFNDKIPAEVRAGLFTIVSDWFRDRSGF